MSTYYVPSDSGKRSRIILSCDKCRTRKIRCLPAQPPPADGTPLDPYTPCAACVKSNSRCEWTERDRCYREQNRILRVPPQRTVTPAASIPPAQQPQPQRQTQPHSQTTGAHVYQGYHDSTADPRQWEAAYGQIPPNDPNFQRFLATAQAPPAPNTGAVHQSLPMSAAGQAAYHQHGQYAVQGMAPSMSQYMGQGTSQEPWDFSMQAGPSSHMMAQTPVEYDLSFFQDTTAHPDASMSAGQTPGPSVPPQNPSAGYYGYYPADEAWSMRRP